MAVLPGVWPEKRITSERNFKLGQGESTVEIEKLKGDVEYSRQITELWGKMSGRQG